MKDEDLFSHDEPPPTASDHERGSDNDPSTLRGKFLHGKQWEFIEWE